MANPPRRPARAERTPRVAPQRWSGQAGVSVGPFCCRSVAERFARPAVDFGHFETLARRLAREGDRWFVDVVAVPVEGRARDAR